MYADYNYYTMMYYGSAEDCPIPKGAVLLYLKKASYVMDYFFGSERPDKPYGDTLSMACCEIADCLYRLEKREGIASESNDGYSVSFTAHSSLYKAAYDIAVRYLGVENLLYRGIEI